MIENINKVYFLGAGGIGMSSVARFFLQKGIHVAGYDRTSTLLTRQLEMEGMRIHYDDDPVLIPEEFKDPEETLVIYTPALPETHSEYNFFRSNGFRLAKRSVVLGEITSAGKCVAVAGTHGKTTISGMIAHILHESGFGCNAFLGGISVKHNSNYIFNPQSDYYVVEADEYDRSFLTLSPKIALITAMDPDHLDVYNNFENMKSAFSRFAYQVDDDGVLILKKGLSLNEPGGKKILRYSMNEPADYYAYNIQREDLTYSFSLGTPMGVFHQVKTGILGKINVENTVAAIAVAFETGVNPAHAVNLAKTYRGIKRRFEVLIHKKHLVYIDDYAHHPEELRALISSVREIFKDKRISGVFQPHLYSRTRDFAIGFAESLSMLDDIILLDIYPAREVPIEGVTSGIIFNRLANKGKRIMCEMNELIANVGKLAPEVLLTMGAGDIDRMTNPLKEYLENEVI